MLSFPAELPEGVRPCRCRCSATWCCARRWWRARRKEQKKPLTAHYAHLTVHGALHLLGWTTTTSARPIAWNCSSARSWRPGIDDPYLRPALGWTGSPASLDSAPSTGAKTAMSEDDEQSPPPRAPLLARTPQPAPSPASRSTREDLVELLRDAQANGLIAADTLRMMEGAIAVSDLHRRRRHDPALADGLAAGRRASSWT